MYDEPYFLIPFKGESNEYSFEKRTKTTWAGGRRC